MSASYTITATPKVIERVYYAIERCISRPEASAQAINREIETKFGAPLSTQIWTTINLARRDNALSRVKTKTFDFVKHGRVARTGKQKPKPTGEKREPSGDAPV
ncbi:MAG: hypothetical protein L6Q71_10165, partial [Planctomycetes bacterium]|nr:hypothetical protein [Planctomycetota bacterium]